MLNQIRRYGFCHIRFAQYREAGLAVPLFADGKVIAGIVMRYIKSTMKASEVEQHFAPIIMQLAADISEAYGRRLDRARSDSDGFAAGAWLSDLEPGGQRLAVIGNPASPTFRPRPYDLERVSR